MYRELTKHEEYNRDLMSIAITAHDGGPEQTLVRSALVHVRNRSTCTKCKEDMGFNTMCAGEARFLQVCMSMPGLTKETQALIAEIQTKFKRKEKPQGAAK